jgi:hypothetical protein
MNRAVPIAVATFLLAGSLTATGQEPRNRAERASDRRQIQRDMQEQRDDLGDLKQLEALVSRFDQARASKKFHMLRAVDDEIKRIVQAELGESRREMAADRAEVRQSRREVRSSRRELHKGVAHKAPRQVTVDDRRDLRDDRRDLRNDVRDAETEAGSLERRREIALELRDLHGAVDDGSLDRKRELLGELVEIARREIDENAQEIREDRRELREDRRETREDRRRLR